MVVNGKEMDIPLGTTISNLLNKLELSSERVVVEVNLNIIAREQYDVYALDNKDQVEIVNFVGGGC
ncbi:MAG: sulfur carrier protein ThiS [Bacillota bacterium]|nr:sulfur carrier protein ThiS [Bacillota bacterium]